MVRWDVVGLVVSNILSNSWYSLVVPFLPLELKLWGVDISVIGYIFWMYSVAVIIGSPIIGRIMTTVGRKKILVCGLFFMGFAMIGFGIIPLSPSIFMFTILAFVFRFWQGLASCSIQTTSYAIVSVSFPNDQEKYIALIETAVGVGLILGPVIGSSVYAISGFSSTFFIIGGVFLFLTPILYVLIPNSIDKNENVVETDVEKRIHQYEELQPLDSTTTKVSFTKLLWTRRFLLGSMGGMMANFMYCYMEPVLAFRISQFDISSFAIGMFFSIQPISYIFVSFTISWFTKIYANRALIMGGAWFWALSMCLVGPSHYLPNELYIMALGQLWIGGFGLFLMVPVIPEMIQSGSKLYPGRIVELTDISAGVFNSGLGLGQVIGPVFGSYVTKHTDFRTCSDMVGIILFTYAVAYFLLGDGVVLISTFWKEKVNKQFDVIRSSPARNVTMRNRLLSNASHDDNFDLDTVKLIFNTPLMDKANRNKL